MSEGANSGLPPVQDLTDPERTLLALVREGRMDAEIAVRLGLPTGEVKARIEALCAKLGSRDRAALRNGVDREQHPSQVENTRARVGSRRATAGVVLGVFVALVATAGWFVIGGPTSATTATPTVTPFDAAQATASAQLAAVTPVSVSTPPTTIVADREMYDLGQMFVVSGHPFDAVQNVDAREAMTVVYFAAAGVARFDSGKGLPWSFAGGTYSYQVSYATRILAQQVSLTFSPADEHTHLVLGSGDSITYYSDVGEKPALILQAATFGSNFNWHVTVNANGELFIATSPTSADAVIDQSTGALLLGPSASLRPSLVSLGTADVAFTACDITAPPSRCRAVWRATSPVHAPVEGYAECDATGHGTFTASAAGWELDFAPFAGTAGCKAEPRTLLKAGDEMLQASVYEITAKAPTGPLSVAVSQGQLYIGDFVDDIGCPCLGGD